MLLAETVTVDIPGGVVGLVPIVIVTVTGFAAVGLTELPGEKLQVAPAGSPLQDRFTAALNDPTPLT